MKVSGEWLERPETQAICAVLSSAGWQALPVGGCVRNALMGVPVADVDIATDARPETVSDLSKRAGFKVVQTGVEHGTLTVIAGGIPYEITTFRRDVETDGRRAVVAFSDRLDEDAARRDFTMNALYARPDGALIDPLGGIADVLARRVRFVGDAETRIREDYLRILRFFRFHAWYGDPVGGLNADGLAACAALSPGIETLSRERLGTEMKKLLTAPDPAPAVAAMAMAGVLAQVLPGADHRALAPLVHLEDGRDPRWQRRLAVLGGKDAASLLRLSRTEGKELLAIAESARNDEADAALGWRLGAVAGADAVLARSALTGAMPGPDWADEVARGAASRFPVKAADLPELQGPQLGARLSALEDRWLQGGLRLTRADLLR